MTFATGLRWGETAALVRSDIDWRRERLHVQRTWSSLGRRIEPCKDGAGRWVKIQARAAVEALRVHAETMALEADLHGWTAEQRALVFPTAQGRILRYSVFLRAIWWPLFSATKLAYRTPHAMRHSYATWLLEDGADLRYVRDQLGHASTLETESVYGHLEQRRHEARVDLDSVLVFGPGRNETGSAPEADGAPAVSQFVHRRPSSAEHDS